MKPAGLLFLVPAGFACVVQANAVTTARLSPETRAHIRAGLPAFQPQPTTDEPTEPGPFPPATDSNLLILPKLTVKERRLPPDAANHLMTPTAFKRKMCNLYLDEVDSLGPLNSLLNRFTIPLLSPSRVERGKAIYINRELDRLTHLMPPAEASTLNDFYDQLAKTTGSGASARR